ncbi:MAG: hypothetical protein RBR82_09880 [Pseudomonas sp.]|nr:hypothetical protein [Pseudomonas sp.]
MERTLEFDPIHSTLRDMHGHVLKKLVCPINKTWSSLSSSDATASTRQCENCEKSVTDTSLLTYEQVVTAVEQDPDMCLRVRLDQDNIIVRVRHD